MKYVALIAVSMFVGQASFAKKTHDKVDKEKSEYTMPITGTKHIKETETQKVKTATGEAEVDVTKKTTIDRHGKKTEKVKVDAESENTGE